MSDTIQPELIDYEALPHILVVDDDDRIRELLSRYLTESGFFVSTAENAMVAQEIMTLAQYDALVVDVMMPGQDGMEFTQQLRETNDVPVLLLTAMSETEDRIKGLTSGADDYLAKPFDPRELVLRLQAILRRTPVKQSLEPEIQIGHWIYSRPKKHLQSQEGAPVALTDGEITLLEALLKQAGEVISREVLSDACDMDPDKRTIDVQVTRLRRKLEKDSNRPLYLQTVRGKGYVLRVGE